MTEQQLTVATMRRTGYSLLESIYKGEWDAVLEHCEDLALMAAKQRQDEETMEGCDE
jgi:DNA-binding winged helix-turn-helix (wHTH) protein